MGFTRKFLTEHGVPDDQVDTILAERNRTLGEYVPKSDVQAQIDEALKAATPQEVNVEESDAYKALLRENAKIKALSSDTFATVKAPYRDMIWEKLDHEEKHKPYDEQIAGLSESLPDLFTKPEETPSEPKPVFGGDPQGKIPSGETGKSFMDGWGFLPKRKE